MNKSPAAPLAAAATQTAGLRRSALVLYAMTNADREWVFERLPAKARALLDPMIGELRELGVATDRALLRDAVQQSESLQAKDSTPVAETDEQALEKFSHEIIAQAFDAEPAGLIAKLLSCRQWSWRESVLQRIGVYKRRQILEALKAYAPAIGRESRLTAVLMQQLVIRARQIRDEGTTSRDAWRTRLAQLKALTHPWLQRFSPRSRA
jgi:hypothetical protein